MNKNANFVKSCQCVLLFNMEVLNSADSVYYNVTNYSDASFNITPNFNPIISIKTNMKWVKFMLLNVINFLRRHIAENLT